MKTGASLSLALAASVLAAQDDILPSKRDVATINNVIMMTTTALTQLDTTVKAFNGQDFTALASDSANVQRVLKDGTMQVMGTSEISANDAVSLQSSLGPIQTVAMSLVTDLGSKKQEVQQAGLCSVVQQQTTAIGTAASDLLSATVMKVPANLRAVATQLTGSFTAQLNDVSLSFNSANCTNADGGAAAGVAFSNSSTTSTSSTPGAVSAKNSASTRAVSAFGFVLVGAVGFMML